MDLFRDAKRQRGNYFFQRGEYGSAINVYQRFCRTPSLVLFHTIYVSRATKILSSDAEQTTEEDDEQLFNFAAAVYNNLAATQLKVKYNDCSQNHSLFNSSASIK